MTRISTSTKDPFRRQLYWSVGVLAATCLILIGLSLTQPPRFRAATIDVTKLTGQINQQVILYANQPLGNLAKKQVTITPHAPMQMTASGRGLAILFTQRLSYDTRYTITVKATGKRDAHYSFRTGKPNIYYMHLDEGTLGDKIVKRQADGKETTVYQSKQILDYVALDDALIVNIREQDYTSSLHRIDLKTGSEQPIALPKLGVVADLLASPDKQSFGFVFTSQDYEERYNSTLMISESSRINPKVAAGFNGQPLRPLNWRYGPDSTTLISQLLDFSLIVTSIDGKSTPLPLGQLTPGGLSADGKSVIAGDSQGALQISLGDNKLTRIPTTPYPGDHTIVVDVTPLNNSVGYLLHTQTDKGDRFNEYLTLSMQGKAKTIFAGEDDKSITSVRLSPNDQYAAIQIAEPTLDGTSYTTKILDMRSGKVVRTISGTLVQWQ